MTASGQIRPFISLSQVAQPLRPHQPTFADIHVVALRPMLSSRDRYRLWQESPMASCEGSKGQPWSFSVLGERHQQVYRSAREAAVEARTGAPTGLPIRVRLAGLAVDSGAATLAMLMPCTNISTAARLIAQLSDRCKI